MIELYEIGKNVKKYRKRKGLTQAALAEQANISTVHMSHIETGNVSMSLECLIKICELLDITPNHLLLNSTNIDKDTNLLNEHFLNLTNDEKTFALSILDLLQTQKINR